MLIRKSVNPNGVFISQFEGHSLVVCLYEGQMVLVVCLYEGQMVLVVCLYEGQMEMALVVVYATLFCVPQLCIKTKHFLTPAFSILLVTRETLLELFHVEVSSTVYPSSANQ